MFAQTPDDFLLVLLGMDDSENRLQAAGHGGRAELDVVVPGAQVENGIHAILALASE